MLDAGVGGDATAGRLARLDWALADQPSHVIVELGGNDGLRALPPEQMEQNLDAIISRLRHDVAVLLAGMLTPPNLGRTWRGFQAAFARVAGRRRATLSVLPRGRRRRPSAQPARRHSSTARGSRSLSSASCRS